MKEKKKDNVHENRTPFLHTQESGLYGSIGTSSMEDEGAQPATLVPTRELTLTWQDINVSVAPQTTLFSQTKQFPLTPPKLLHNVNGVALPGQLLAIMGSSGAGKTTLMNVLNERSRNNLVVEGHICINGRSATRAMVALSGYVTQDNLFMPTLTPREQLIFQSMVRMHESMSRQARLRRVEEVIEELNLEKCANTMIGSIQQPNISGGERKRLAFACEVLTDPPLLFCDEPTSGLDSFMAETVVNVLRSFASKGKTVICTIHQPPSEISDLVDRLYLLANGRVAFTGSKEAALQFFQSTGFQCPLRYNPTDFFLRVLSVWPLDATASKARMAAICDAYEASSYRTEMATEITLRSGRGASDGDLWDTGPMYRSSRCAQLKALLWRAFIHILREPMLMRARIIQYLAVAVFTGILYWQVELNQMGVSDINGVGFFLFIFLSVTSVVTTIAAFPAEYAILWREHVSGMYRLYYGLLVRMLSELPGCLLLTLLITSIVYFMVGLELSASSFFEVYGVVALVTLTAISFGYFTCAIILHSVIGQMAAQACLFVFQVASSFFHRIDTFPTYLLWMRYLSWYAFGYEIFLIIQWGDVESIPCAIEHNNTAVPCYKDGDAVLRSNGVDKENLLFDVAILCGQLLVWRLLSLIILRMRSRS